MLIEHPLAELSDWNIAPCEDTLLATGIFGSVSSMMFEYSRIHTGKASEWLQVHHA